MTTELSPERRTFLQYWVIGIAVAYLVLGILAVYIVQHEKQTANRNHALRMDPHAVEPGKTPPDAMPSNTDFKTVHVGVYLDGIDNFSIKDSYWTATFYLWFRWHGDKSLDPGKHFQLVDAKIEKKELQDSYSGADGTNYQVYKLVAKMTKFFNTTRVPLDDHMLNIYLEDTVRDVSQLRFVADPATNVSSRVKIPGYDIRGFTTVVKPHTYKTTYGDPRMEEGKRTTNSEFNFGLTIKRNGVGVYLKLFIGLFAGVLLTIGSFFIRPSDTGPRYGLPSAAYFGAIANTYMVSSMLPPSGQFGLADLVTGTGLFTISMCVIASLISGFYFLRKKEEDFSRELDRVSWKYIALGYILVNVALPFSAFS